MMQPINESTQSYIESISLGELADDERCYNPFPKHVVVDLETTGLEAGCRILTIGAITCDLQHQFYVRVEITDSGRFTNLPSTINWWTEQSQEAIKEAWASNIPRVSIGEALDLFNTFLTECEATAIVGNGVSFDNAILRETYNICNISLPDGFDTRIDYCYRTLKNTFKWIIPSKFKGTPHVAIYDALHEAKHMNKILNSINWPIKKE